jgi:N-acetylglucosaminyldiphosphoundecaprenol N-acetyl-beta-D-mannosaminyltransferase
LVDRINRSGANVLLVAFGVPKQDFWITRHAAQLTNVRIAIGVGGAFDYLSGRIRRAPAVFRRMGLEWLWRVVQEPRRIPRILNATVVFLWTVLRSRKTGKRS